MRSNLFEFIRLLSEAPETQIDPTYTQEMRNFLRGDDLRDPVLFLRNIQDRMVFTSGCSDFTIIAITAMLSSYPESPDEAKKRRDKLVV